jgi:hypothetical protein
MSDKNRFAALAPYFFNRLLSLGLSDVAQYDPSPLFGQQQRLRFTQRPCRSGYDDDFAFDTIHPIYPPCE